MRVRRQTLSGRFVRKPSSGNKIADPAGTWTKVWSQWREHLGCPGLATLGPLPVPLECEGHRKETIETLRLRGKFLLEIRERERAARGICCGCLSGTGRVGEREMVGREDRQFLGLWEQRQQKAGEPARYAATGGGRLAAVAWEVVWGSDPLEA